MYSSQEFFSVELIDCGKAFNPLSHDEKPTDDISLEDAEVGGLGIFFMRQSFDEINYKREIFSWIVGKLFHAFSAAEKEVRVVNGKRPKLNIKQQVLLTVQGKAVADSSADYRKEA